MTIEANLTQCPQRTEKGRQCKLTAGHKLNTRPNGKTIGDGHRYILRDKVAQPRPLADVLPPGFSLTMESVPKGEDVRREYSRTAAPRSEDEKRVDKDAARAYALWVKAGSPTDEAKYPWQRYIFPPAAFDTVIAMLRLATNLGGSVQGKALKYRRKTHESGNSMVYFMFTDKNGTSA